MAQNRRSFNAKAISQQKRDLKNALRQEQIGCDHKNPNGPTLTSIHDDSVMVKDKHKYSDKTFVCDQCGDIVPFDTFTNGNIDDAFTVLYGICNQSKILAELTDTEYDNITAVIETLDSIQSTLIPFYKQRVIKPLKNSGKGNKNGGNRSKGKISIGKSFGR